MLEKLRLVEERYMEMEERAAQPDFYADPKAATKLLKEQKHTITEIAEMTGFSDAKYFREVFKKHFNVSPSQYAKEAGFRH